MFIWRVRIVGCLGSELGEVYLVRSDEGLISIREEGQELIEQMGDKKREYKRVKSFLNRILVVGIMNYFIFSYLGLVCF